MGVLSAWWNKPRERTYLAAARQAWERGDAVYIHREHQPWSTSSWASSQRVENDHLNAIAALGWKLAAGSREVGHGTVLYTFVR